MTPNMDCYVVGAVPKIHSFELRVQGLIRGFVMVVTRSRQCSASAEVLAYAYVGCPSSGTAGNGS